MADTTITPPVGGLTASGAVVRAITIGLVLFGYQPVVGAGIVGATGSAGFTGSAPLATETSPTAVLTLTGYAPGVSSVNTTITPSVGTLVLGIVVDNSVAKTPGAASLTLTGTVTDIINPVAPKPTSGVLTLTGLAPVVSTVPASTTGTLTLTGYTPLIDRGIVPGAASLKCTPSATVSWYANTESDLAGYNVYHGLASRTYTEHVTVGTTTLFYVWNNLSDGTNYFAVTAFDTTGNESVFSDEVSTVISGRGYAPTVTVNTGSGVLIPTGLGSLALTGAQPIVGLGILPSVGAITITGNPNNLLPTTGTLTFSGIAPTVTQGGPLNSTAIPGTGSLTLTGYVKLQMAEPGYGVMTLQGYAGTATIQILGSVAVTPAAGSLVFFSPMPFNPVWAKHVNKILAPGGVPEHA